VPDFKVAGRPRRPVGKHRPAAQPAGSRPTPQRFSSRLFLHFGGLQAGGSVERGRNGEQRHDQQPTHGVCEGFLAQAARPTRTTRMSNHRMRSATSTCSPEEVCEFRRARCFGRPWLPAAVPRRRTGQWQTASAGNANIHPESLAGTRRSHRVRVTRSSKATLRRSGGHERPQESVGSAETYPKPSGASFTVNGEQLDMLCALASTRVAAVTETPPCPDLDGCIGTPACA
jgi:hypothetical protein